MEAFLGTIMEEPEDDRVQNSKMVRYTFYYSRYSVVSFALLGALLKAAVAGLAGLVGLCSFPSLYMYFSSRVCGKALSGVCR